MIALVVPAKALDGLEDVVSAREGILGFAT
jgi:hypothetical protein